MRGETIKSLLCVTNASDRAFSERAALAQYITTVTVDAGGIGEGRRQITYLLLLIITL